MFPLQESQDFELDPDAFIRFVRQRGSRVAVICNPNNPDGGYVPRREVIRLLDNLLDLDLVVVDESFIDFVDAEPYTSVADEAAVRPNVIVLKSLGKNFGLHGIRFGYLVANPAIAGTVRRALPKWNLNSFAEVVVFLLKEHQAEYRRSLQLLAHDRRTMSHQLAALPGVTVFASQGNFVLVKLPEGTSGVQLRDYLIEQHGVFVRECGNKLGSTSQFLRLVVRPQDDVRRLLNGLGAFLYDKVSRPVAPAGAASGAGGEWRGTYGQAGATGATGTTGSAAEQAGRFGQAGRTDQAEQVSRLIGLSQTAASGAAAPGRGPIQGGVPRPQPGGGWPDQPSAEPLEPVVEYGRFRTG
jgi:threonine-phosphate decarboxylase